MATFSGRRVSDTFKNLLNIDNSNSGIDGTLRDIQDGEGTVGALQLSTAGVKFTGTVAYSSYSVAFGGNFSTGGTFSTTGTFSSGGNFSTGSTFSTIGTFSSGGNFSTSSTFSAAGAVSIGAALTTSANALTLTTTGSTNVTLPTTGTLSTLAGTETLTNKTLTSPKTNQILDTNGNEGIIITATSSAVNEITVTNAATGSGPTIATTGSDTNSDLAVSAKGTGKVKLGQATSGGIVLVADQSLLDSSNNIYLGFTKTATAVNYVNITNTATNNGPIFSVAGSDSNIDMRLRTKGTGVMRLQAANTTMPVVWSTGTSLQHDTSFSIPNTSASRTITLPDQDLTLTPVVFMVRNGSAYTGTSAAKISMNTSIIDTGSYWDNVNFRFLPLIAGHYHISFVASFTSAAAGTGHIYIYKNGSEVARATMATSNAGSQVQSAMVSMPVYFNGSTDYVEAWGDVQNAGTWQIDSAAARTYFSGQRVGLGV